MYVLALSIDLHLPECRSLKAKRQVVKPLVEGLRRRLLVAAAEVDHHEQWQRSCVGVAIVSSSHHHAGEIADEVERFVWANPDLQVLDIERSWLELG